MKLFLLILMFGCSSNIKTTPENLADQTALTKSEVQTSGKTDTATLAGGCFWCMEAAFEQIIGVKSVVSGYSGGTAESATYKATSTGRTGHAEAIQIYYDPEIISFSKLLDIFFVAHDPTQLDRQGPDVGPQYRSEIFYHNNEQKTLIAQKMIEWAPKYPKPIVTKVSKLNTFYLAEAYHQDYEKRNPYQPYILSVSKPKVERVKNTFPELIKKDN
jgi:peptide-methionine (S)-S-oxide reductase